jgi:hypothetical protein
MLSGFITLSKSLHNSILKRKKEKKLLQQHFINSFLNKYLIKKDQFKCQIFKF